MLALLSSVVMLAAGCNYFRLGSYTVENRSSTLLYTVASIESCDDAAARYRTGNWQAVAPLSSAKISTFGVMKCVLITDVNGRTIVAEEYVDGRTFTVMPDRTYTATALPEHYSEPTLPTVEVPDFGPGANIVFFAGTLGAIAAALAFSAKFLYDYGRPRPVGPAPAFATAFVASPVAAPAPPVAAAGPRLVARHPPIPQPEEAAATTRPASPVVVYALAFLLAVGGGVLGIVGAFVQEMQASSGFSAILLAFLGGPIIEEALKPAGIYIALVRWPQVIRGGLFVALLAAVSGVVFGLIESFVYVSFYHPEGGDDYVTFRYTVPVALHALASFTVGLGLTPRLIDWAAGRIVDVPARARNMFLAGVGIHAAYNITATVLSLTGVLDFE